MTQQPPGVAGACSCSPVADSAPDLVHARLEQNSGFELVKNETWTPDYDGLCDGRPMPETSTGVA
ncbi:MAG: hypothetical protein GYB65_15320 [Chloroflexi bacterium]|nr:hypothetical protein [Chloroflexota bacterium]